MKKKNENDMKMKLSGREVKEVMGKKNKGKKKMEIERMMQNGRGMIGMKMRMIEREVYNSVEERVGEENVQMVKGEEKIVKKGERY